MTPGEPIARFPMRRRYVPPFFLFLLGAACLAWVLKDSIPEVYALFQRALASQLIVTIAGTPLTPDDFSNVKPWSALVVTVLSWGAALPYFLMPRAIALHRGGLVVEGPRGRVIPWSDVERIYDQPRTRLTGVDFAWCSRTLPKLRIRGELIGVILDTGEPAKVIAAIEAQRKAAQERRIPETLR